MICLRNIHLWRWTRVEFWQNKKHIYLQTGALCHNILHCIFFLLLLTAAKLLHHQYEIKDKPSEEMNMWFISVCTTRLKPTLISLIGRRAQHKNQSCFLLLLFSSKEKWQCSHCWPYRKIYHLFNFKLGQAWPQLLFLWHWQSGNRKWWISCRTGGWEGAF